MLPRPQHEVPPRPQHEVLPRPQPAPLAEAIARWRDALPADRVLTDGDARRAAGRATFAAPAEIPAILEPRSLDEVCALVEIAARTGVALYPVSTGRNWGYGSGVPAQPGCVVVRLSRMREICDYDDELGTVVVEPGVTQGQLAAFLRGAGDRFWLDCAGAGPDVSVVGNALERGFGHTPYADHCAQVAWIEVVTGTGAVLRTGFADFPARRRPMPVGAAWARASKACSP